MPKILAKSGDSLADVYDVKGSIAGVEELLSQDVNLVHEMGGVIFSERVGSNVLEIATGAIAQSTDFNINFNLGRGPRRLLGVQVFHSSTIGTARIDHCQVSITTPPAGSNTDIPIWYWNAGVNATQEISVMKGGVLADLNLLVPSVPPLLPNLLMGDDQPNTAPLITMRGTTIAFGAGTIVISVHVYFAFTQLGGVSSRGLPMPGW